MRGIQILLVLTMALTIGVSGASSAQEARAEARASGIAGASLSIQGPGGLSKDGPNVGVAPPRQVVAAIKDRITVQNTLRRRWEAAGPDERKKMLDLQRKLSDRRPRSIDALDRKEILDRMTSRPRVAASPKETEARIIVKPSSGDSFLSDGQRRALRERVRDLSPEQRQNLRTRISELKAMNEVDQAILREQLEQWVNLPQEDRAQIDTYRERWESMTPEEQDILRNRMLRLREMTSEQRQELLNRTLDEPLSE